VGTDTLLLCEGFNVMNTEVWEAVCLCGSHQLQERRGVWSGSTLCH